ncbi:hypothetical protein BS78_03G384900 [Paspalum vaginatum]|nr:hypothetical protein BS78_03G384900 [Paspalum vaginatum]
MADALEPLPPPECGGGGESGRSSPSPAASPEFEFWMVGRNPAPALLTADELFSGGVVLPLHTLQAAAPDPAAAEGEAGAKVVKADADSAAAALPLPASTEPGQEAEAEAAVPLAESGIAPTPDLPAVTFKWKDIFKAGGGEARDRAKKAERRVSGNAELININIWPFSRSRSAGHSAGPAAGGSSSLSRGKPSLNNPPNASAPSANTNAGASACATSAPPAPAPAPAPRKVSSAPCSRSNSRGESSGPAPAVPAAAAAVAVAAAAPPIAAAAATAEEDAATQAAPLPAAAATTTSMLRRLVPGQGRNSGNTGSNATGIRVGRPSPVWQLRRNKLQQAAAEQKHAGAKKKAAAAASAEAAAASSDGKAAPSVAAPAAGCRNNAGCAEGAGEEGNPTQGLFGLRTFFSKKVY